MFLSYLISGKGWESEEGGGGGEREKKVEKEETQRENLTTLMTSWLCFKTEP